MAIGLVFEWKTLQTVEFCTTKTGLVLKYPLRIVSLQSFQGKSPGN